MNAYLLIYIHSARFLSVNSPPLHQSSFLRYFKFVAPLPANSQVMNHFFFLLNRAVYPSNIYKVESSREATDTKLSLLILLLYSSTTIVVFNTQNGIKARTKFIKEVMVKTFVMSVIVAPPTNVYTIMYTDSINHVKT